jgi:uncharacterized lipoprotein YehR (DUF1307 family)
MKNIKILLLIIMCVVVFTGCGKDKSSLKCTEGSNTSIQFDYKDDKISKITIITTEEASSEEEAASSVTLLKNVSDQKETEGLKIELYAEGKTVNAKYVYTVDKLSQDEKMSLSSSGIPYDMSYDDVEKQFESHNGVTCK